MIPDFVASLKDILPFAHSGRHINRAIDGEVERSAKSSAVKVWNYMI